MKRTVFDWLLLAQRFRAILALVITLYQGVECSTLSTTTLGGVAKSFQLQLLAICSFAPLCKFHNVLPANSRSGARAFGTKIFLAETQEYF